MSEGAEGWRVGEEPSVRVSGTHRHRAAEIKTPTQQLKDWTLLQHVSIILRRND
jgi:hypothetical protein